MVCGNSDEAKQEAIRLIRLLGMRGVDCGTIRSARVIEGLTPILLQINRRYHVRSSGIKITGIEEEN
jgi:predicted dinucleotide-binding enzyme